MAINREMLDETLILENTETGTCTKIKETICDDHVCVAPQGELTSYIVNDLEDELTSIALVRSSIHMDMGGVETIDNSVISMFLNVQHMIDDRDGELVIKNVKPDVFRRFEEMDLDQVFYFESEI